MEITPTSIKPSDGSKYDLDVIVFAIGFEAVDGMYHDVSITGQEGLSVHDHWADGTKSMSFLATNMAGFPDTFLINGPQGPLTNVPPLIETRVEFVAGLITTAEAERKKRSGDREIAQQPIIEVTQEAEDAWLEQTDVIGESTVFVKGGSWPTGDNVEGKKHNFLYYMGGVVNYNKVVQADIEVGYPNFKPFF